MCSTSLCCQAGQQFERVPAGKSSSRNALLAKQDAAKAAKHQKALLHTPIIDLSNDKSDDEKAPIDLINLRSPAVTLHGCNRFASAAGTSYHGSQPHPSSQPIISHNSRSDASSSGDPGYNQTCGLTAQRGGNLSIARTHSGSRKRSAPSHVSPAKMSDPFLICKPHQSTAAASSDSHQVGKRSPGQHISRPAATKPLQVLQRSAQSELAGGHIDLVKVTEDYSGALQAADKCVQHASTDPALAKALAEKAELEQQLKVKSFSSCNCLCIF